MIQLQVQFGITPLHEWVFQKESKLQEAIGWVQLEVLEKPMSAINSKLNKKSHMITY